MLLQYQGSATARSKPPITRSTNSTDPPPLQTVADYTCQALVSSLLFSHFPTDLIVGEEDSSELNTPENVATKAAIVRLANEAMGEELSATEEGEWAGVKSVERGEKEWLAIIDRGNSEGGPGGRAFRFLSFPAFEELTKRWCRSLGARPD